MTNALEIRGLCKHYDGFSLENIDLTLARGAVMACATSARGGNVPASGWA